MADKTTDKRRKDPRDVPLGSGLAGRARTSILTRRQQIDSAVDRATRGGDNELHRKIRDIDRETTR
nr:hypothetical protein [Gammaproteobacteria bacterium]